MPNRPLYRWTEEWMEATAHERDRLLNLTARELMTERPEVADLIRELLDDIVAERLRGPWRDDEHEETEWAALHRWLDARLMRHLIRLAGTKIGARLDRLIDEEADEIVAEIDRERREQVPDIVWEFERPVAA